MSNQNQMGGDMPPPDSSAFARPRQVGASGSNQVPEASNMQASNLHELSQS